MNNKYKYSIVAILIVYCVISFGRIIGNDFVNYDDFRLITENSYIQAGINGQSIKWAFTDSYYEYWHPLTWLSIMMDWRLFGVNASGHHLVSLLLHIGAVLFLFLFLNKATKNLWPSAFAAVLFALHPLRVESVAWAAERKDVLSMFFGMATLYFYVYYAEKPRISQYLVCLILFALSLMSKPMLVTLPCVLLLLDYWPLSRWGKKFNPVNIPKADNQKISEIKELRQKENSPVENKIMTSLKGHRRVINSPLLDKTPFFLLSLIVSIMLIVQLRVDNQMLSMQQVPFSERIMNALMSYVSYLGKTFWPVDLAVFYPYDHSFQLWQVSGSAFVLLAISVVVVYLIKKYPFLTVGWFWYLGTLFPVIGFMQAGSQAMADRYTYLPSIGIAIMLAWGITALIKRDDQRKRILFPLAMAVATLLAVLTWQQCAYWKNSMTLASHALRVTKDNYLAHNILASFLVQENKITEAMYHFNKSILLKPDYPYTHNNRGTVYIKLGQYKSAIEDFNTALNLRPNYANAFCNRGMAYFLLGQDQLAIEDYNQAILLKPDDATIYNNLGGAYFNAGQYQLAVENYSQAIRLKKNYVDAFNNRASSYLMLGNKKLGCDDAQKACTLGDCSTLEIAKSKSDCP